MSDQAGFYLGKVFDLENNRLTDEKVFYDPADLTTHGFVTGMTGSGKTGLCIGLLEEAAMKKIPALMVDPKGDLTNLLLHFPDLKPEDFKPWVDPDQARRDGKDVDTLAAETAVDWKNGLEQWGLGREDILKLSKSVAFTIYTPGSTAGVPVNILSSFQAPEIDWQSNSEILREEISSVVTGLLGLVGMTDIDQLKSREHILLSNIVEDAWSKGQSLDLTELILRVQNPPFERLGAFPVDNLFPAKDRLGLAMLLNNFLASPSFQSWIEGSPLDIQAMLYKEDGTPRHCIFYIAHLPDNERMFFVTLLFAAIEAWMRTQRGTSSLRALVYFDEIVGYLPPVANPPSRPIILRMLKQARAFGVGLLLATQNPVDMDYKALSNAGTWFIGRLQTERDKNRLLDGLESAHGEIARSDLDKILSAQKKRVFLLHNVHAKKPVLFNTRWDMNYLAGPLTRAQLPQLMALADPDHTVKATSAQGAGVGGGVRAQTAAEPVVQSAVAQQPAVVAQPMVAQPVSPAASETVSVPAGGYQQKRGVIPSGFSEFFLPADLGVNEAVLAARQNHLQGSAASGMVYKPALLAQSEIRYVVQKYGMEMTRKMTSLVFDNTGNQLNWEGSSWPAFQSDSFQTQPMPNSLFDILPAWLSDAKALNAYRKDFENWVYRNGAVRIKVNTDLKLYSQPGESEEDFKLKAQPVIKDRIEKEQKKVKDTYEKKLNVLENKIRMQEMEVNEKKADMAGRSLDTLSTGGEFLMGLFGKRKKNLSTSISKVRMANNSRLTLKQEEQELEILKNQLAGLEKEYQGELEKVERTWQEQALQFSEVPVTPTKTNIFIDRFGIVWVPYYLIKSGSAELEVLATRNS